MYASLVRFNLSENVYTNRKGKMFLDYLRLSRHEFDEQTI